MAKQSEYYVATFNQNVDLPVVDKTADLPAVKDCFQVKALVNAVNDQNTDCDGYFFHSGDGSWEQFKYAQIDDETANLFRSACDEIARFHSVQERQRRKDDARRRREEGGDLL